MFIDDVARVHIRNDQTWEASFVSWLEDNEKNNIGVEDGVFVATVDSALRILQPSDEEHFIKSCTDVNLTTLTIQKLKKFTSNGLYHFGVESASQTVFNAFKSEASQLRAYKSDTCCTQVLNQENGLEKLLEHVHCDAMDKNVTVVGSERAFDNTKSRVLLEEAAMKLRQVHDKYSESTSTCTWEQHLKPHVKKCPDLECVDVTDSEDDQEDVIAHKRIKIDRKGSEEESNINKQRVC